MAMNVDARLAHWLLESTSLLAACTAVYRLAAMASDTAANVSTVTRKNSGKKGFLRRSLCEAQGQLTLCYFVRDEDAT